MINQQPQNQAMRDPSLPVSLVYVAHPLSCLPSPERKPLLSILGYKLLHTSTVLQTYLRPTR